MNIKRLFKLLILLAQFLSGSMLGMYRTTNSSSSESKILRHQAKVKHCTFKNVKFAARSSYFFKFINYYLTKYGGKDFNFSSNIFLAWAELPYLACVDIRKREDIVPIVLRAIERYIGFPYVSFIFIDQKILDYPYGVQKIAMGHEVCHCAQHNEELDIITTKNRALYPKGPEQEADTEAMLNCGCYECAQECAIYRPDESEDYLTQKEAKEILKTMDPHQLCPYHQGRAEGIPHEVLMEEIEKGIREV